MTIKQAHKKKIPFIMSGKIRDYESGREYFNFKTWAGPYEGYCFVGADLFKTWIENGERCWACEELVK